MVCGADVRVDSDSHHIIDMTYIMLTSFVDILSDNREPTSLH